MKKHRIELDGQEMEIKKDDDGKFIIPKKFRNKHTALKPAFEPIVLAQKSYDESYGHNLKNHGVGGLNIDGCRIEAKDGGWEWGTQTDIKSGGYGSKRPSDGDVYDKDIKGGENGRWPPNVILDPQSAEMLDRQSGKKCGSGHWPDSKVTGYGEKIGDGEVEYYGAGRHDGEGGASRFFYSAKAHKSERQKMGKSGMVYELKDDVSKEKEKEIKEKLDEMKGD